MVPRSRPLNFWLLCQYCVVVQVVPVHCSSHKKGVFILFSVITTALLLFSYWWLHTCQVGKVQKREISLFASCQRGRFCAKPFCNINYCPSTFKFRTEILKMMRYFLLIMALKLIIWCITFYYCTLWILCWLSNAFSLQNSIQFTLLRRKW